MQHNHRSRLPPPPPFSRGGGGPGYPRVHKQLYYAPPPFPPVAPPPVRKYEVLMEAGRLAAEYLVSQGVLPPAALQRGGGISGAWATHPLPPPPPQQQQELHGFYGQRRYENEYSNNPGARPRRANGTSCSSSSRDDYSSGSYNGRGKRKYGEYKRGYDSGRDREKERGRSSSNGRRYEDEDEDGATSFRRERQGSRWSDKVRSRVTEAVREETPLTAKAVEGLDMEDTWPKIVSSVDNVRKDTDAAPKVQEETEEGEMEDNSEALNSESEVVKQEMNTDVNNFSAGVVMRSDPEHLPDGMIQDEIPDEEDEDDVKVSDEAALDHNNSDGEVTNLENDMHDGKKNLIDYCNSPRAPTRPRSVRPHRNAASITGETTVVKTVDPISSGQASQMVMGESVNESSLTNIESEHRGDQICQENNNSSAVCAEPIELMHLQENGISVVNGNMAEDEVDTQPHVVQECKEETNLSPSTDAHDESLMQETALSPFMASQKDSLMQETVLSPVTANQRDSLVEESTLRKEDSLTQKTDLSQTISSHENNLKLQFKEGVQMCDIGKLPQDVDLIELSDQRSIVAHGTEAVIKMEEGKLDQPSSLNLSDLELVGGTEFAAMQDCPAMVQHSEAGSSAEPHHKQQEAPETFSGANTSATGDFPLQNKDIQVIDIECGTPVEVGGFDSSKSKNEMVCSNMDSVMDPDIHTDVIPGIQDGYSLVLFDILGSDIPCYPSMQSDLDAGLGVNDSEGITVMDDPIYGSLTDIGFMDVWGQPTQDYDKFF